MGACVAVAFSGGRDSTALLHATACAARESGGLQVLALHVHHGLSSSADSWLRHAESLCAEWASQGLPVSLLSRRVVLSLSAGQSLEAEARRARYGALTEMATQAGCDLILLAHHRRDQAETLLLQALRGGGVSGLAGMPQQVWRDDICWARPWLAYPREAIEAYVARHELSFVDDDSNEDERFARNRLRRQVWPALVAAFPQAEASLATSASHVADCLPGVLAWQSALLDGLCMPAQPAQLNAVAWSALSAAERRASLALWYRLQAGQPLPGTWLERLAQEVPAMLFRQHPGRWRELGLSLYRGVLTLEAPAPFDLASPTPLPDAQHLCIQNAGDWPLPDWHGVLRVSLASEGGVSPSLLKGLSLRPRSGGEQFQAGPGRPPRSLKKQFQSAGVPTWDRQGPLLYAGEQLVFVPGLGVDARCLAAPGQPQWALDWVPATC